MASKFEMTPLKTIYDIYKDLFTKKSGGKLCEDFNFDRVMNPFMIARLLRMHDSYVNFALIVSANARIWTKKDVYLFLFKNLPKLRSAPYADYIKRKKNDQPKEGKVREVDEEGFRLI